MFAFLLSPLGKLIGVGALAFIIGGVSVGWATHAIDNGSYQKLVAQKATDDAARATAAVKQMEVWGKQMHDAAAAYNAALPTLSTQIDAAISSAQIRVRDNGPGMSESVRSRVFEPYFSTKNEGTGLGLAIVKRIITDHDGQIRVESNPGEGTIMACQSPGTRHGRDLAGGVSLW